MAKFVRRKFKRAYKKKRFTRKRTITRRKSTPYDGMIKVKLSTTQEMNDNTATGIVSIRVHWGDQITGPAVPNNMIIQDTPEWVRYSQLYKYFCVQGVKMEYKPYTFSTGITNVVSEELLVGSTPDASPLDITTIRLAVDFKCQRAQRNYNKYVGVAKSRMRNGSMNAGAVGDGGGSMRWALTNSGSRYHFGFTDMYAQNRGLTGTDAAAIVYVTWYIWFKTQRVDT